MPRFPKDVSYSVDTHFEADSFHEMSHHSLRPDVLDSVGDSLRSLIRHADFAEQVYGFLQPLSTDFEIMGYFIRSQFANQS
jgi:hypothetical protein